VRVVATAISRFARNATITVTVLSGLAGDADGVEDMASILLLGTASRLPGSDGRIDHASIRPSPGSTRKKATGGPRPGGRR
jgi:hypothetical protein